MINNFSVNCCLLCSNPGRLLFVHPRKKIVLVLIILLCFASSLFALDLIPDSGFAGIGPGINGDARKGIAYGGVLMLGIDLNNQFSTGLKISFFDNLDTVSAHETLGFLRYYFPVLENSKGPFVQMEGGSVIFFERSYHKYLEAFPALTGGLSAGWHFSFGNNWYIEPAARAGYPHIWGFSITAGIRFKSPAIDEQKKETNDQDIDKDKDSADKETVDKDKDSADKETVNKDKDSADKETVDKDKDSADKDKDSADKNKDNADKDKNNNRGIERNREVH